MTEDSITETLRLPRQFGRLPGYGAAGIVRRPWPRPAQAAGSVRGWCCECVDQNPAVAWDEAAAPYILLEPEWNVWRSLPRAAARRRWMRGRVAAKDAVRLLLLDRYSVVAPLEAICVIPNERGQPQVSCVAVPETGTWISVSISHCGNGSVALAAERSKFCRGVGIDVASQTDNHDGLAEGGFASAETALLAGCPKSKRTDWLLCLWCAKEAAGKALGSGLMGNPLSLVVRHVNRTRGTVEIETNTDGEPAAPSDGPTRILARVGCGRGMAFAVARLE